MIINVQVLAIGNKKLPIQRVSILPEFTEGES